LGFIFLSPPLSPIQPNREVLILDFVDISVNVSPDREDQTTPKEETA